MVSGSSLKLYNAMRKYGWDNFEFSIIATADTQDRLNELEEFFISKYDTIQCGYNMAFGGEKNVMFSSEVAEKHRKRMQSPEVRKKISETLKATIAANGGVSENHRRNVSKGLKRFYADGKRPNYKKPFRLTSEHYDALNNAKHKAVYCIDEDGNTVASFESVKAGAQWWYEQGNIVKCLRTLSGAIKRSADNDRYIKGLKWFYRV